MVFYITIHLDLSKGNEEVMIREKNIKTSMKERKKER